MKAAIISLGSTSSKWTAEAMKEEFDVVDELDIRKIEINIGARKDVRLLYSGKHFESYDCIYPKGSFRYAALLRAITSLVQETTYVPLVDSAFSLVHNKLLTHLILQRADLPMPITYLTSTTLATKRLLEKINYPIVMKFPEGTQGKGVMFADSYASASSLLDALQSLKQPFIIQEYVETGSTDIRAIVIGDRVVASMQRIAVHGEKRANIHAGAIGESVELDSHTKRIAVKAAQALGTEICGVDMLSGPTGPLVIELNLSPGLQGIKKATGIDIASKIAKHLYKRTKEFKSSDIATETSKIWEDLGIAGQENNVREILANIDLRGDRILLPDFASKLSSFRENDEIVMKVTDGRIIIERV